MPEKQRTLAGTAEFSAKGTFTGADITVRIIPAPVNHGIAFELATDRLTALIPVDIRNIVEAENRSVIADPENPKICVNITEHILSCLFGLGVDNALISVNAPEIPLVDGSAMPFIRAVDTAGIVDQDDFRNELVINEQIFIDDGSGVMLALPYDGLRITYYLDHSTSIVGKRLADIEITPDAYRKRIGPARTFLHADNVPDIIKKGDIKNPDTSQVVIIHEDHFSQPLRFANEFCYHKILDIMGDLYLTGRRIRGHIIGIRSGHRQNRLLSRLIAEKFNL